jgi:hypothetical protein
MPAHRVPGHGDPAPVQPAGQVRDSGLDHVELVEDARHVPGPRPPVQRRLGIVGLAQAQRLGVQVGGLDHREAVRRPEVSERGA